jgi:hypothetical protein
MANENLGEAKKAKNDEFYTQYDDINKEINAYLEYDPKVFEGKTVLLPCDDPEWSNFTKFFAQNFNRLGLKKLVSTSYAIGSKPQDLKLQPTLFELDSPQFDKKKAVQNGRIFVLDRDTNKDGVINFDDITWSYLEGNGDFKSTEVTRLRDEADVIVTNPPFSLFRTFVEWLTEADKKFLILGNMNAITYKEVFPLIKEDKLWLGSSIHSGDREFEIPRDLETRSKSLRIDVDGKRYLRVDGIRWFTNIVHGRRHQPLTLNTAEDNIRFGRTGVKDIGYQKYDNYDAIEVPYTESIPRDFDGIMGVPISFLSKYNPDQFEIIGASDNGAVPDEFKLPHFKKHNEPFIKGKKLYKRIFIRHRKDK